MGHRTQRGHAVCHQPGKSQRGPGCSQCPPDSRALTQEPRAGGRLGFLLPCLGSWHSGTAQTLGAQGCWCQEWEQPGQGWQRRLVGLLPPPALPPWTRSVLSLSLPGCPLPRRGPAAPHRSDAQEEQEDVPAYSSIPIEQESGPSAAQDRREEGRQRGKETLERHSEQTAALRKKTGCNNSWGEASKAQHPTALPAVTPPYGRGVPAAPCASPVSQKLAQPVSLPRPKAGVQFGDRHRRSLLHKCCH